MIKRDEYYKSTARKKPIEVYYAEYVILPNDQNQLTIHLQDGRIIYYLDLDSKMFKVLIKGKTDEELKPFLPDLERNKKFQLVSKLLRDGKIKYIIINVQKKKFKVAPQEIDVDVGLNTARYYIYRKSYVIMIDVDSISNMITVERVGR